MKPGVVVLRSKRRANPNCCFGPDQKRADTVLHFQVKRLAKRHYSWINADREVTNMREMRVVVIKCVAGCAIAHGCHAGRGLGAPKETGLRRAGLLGREPAQLGR